jgi:SAM-dependent methyltransferase
MGQPRDIRLTFDEQAEVYDEIRPHYPVELFDTLFAWLSDRPAVVEVGPGTGQATGDLLARGARVTAVELGPRLAGVLRRELPSDDLEIVVGDFETVDLPNDAFDAVFSASAYHWIAPRAQRDRPAQLLRAGGVLAVLQLIQVDDERVDHGFFDAVQPVYENYGQGRNGEVPPTRERATARMLAPLQEDPRYVDLTVHHYDWDQTYTSAEYRKLMQSYSPTQMMDPVQREGLLDDMQRFIDERFYGSITRPLVVAFVLARLRR